MKSVAVGDRHPAARCSLLYSRISTCNSRVLRGRISPSNKSALLSPRNEETDGGFYVFLAGLAACQWGHAWGPAMMLTPNKSAFPRTRRPTAGSTDHEPAVGVT